MQCFHSLTAVVWAFAVLRTPLGGCTTLSGEVSGVLRADNNPYQVEEDITVPENATLRLDPGVKVEFAPGVGLTAYGRLIMNGSQEDRVSLGLWEERRASYASNDSIRLINGNGIDSGVVMLNTNGTQQVFCNRYTPKQVAEVVCRQLGFVYSGEATSYTESTYNIFWHWKSSPLCTGTEDSLLDCSLHRGDCSRALAVNCNSVLLGSHWGGIELKSTSKSSLTGVDIALAGVRVHTESQNSSLVPAVQSYAELHIKDTRIIHSAHNGLQIENILSRLHLEDIICERNQRHGIFISTQGHPVSMLNVTSTGNNRSGLVIQDRVKPTENTKDFCSTTCAQCQITDSIDDFPLKFSFSTSTTYNNCKRVSSTSLTRN